MERAAARAGPPPRSRPSRGFPRLASLLRVLEAGLLPRHRLPARVVRRLDHGPLLLDETLDLLPDVSGPILGLLPEIPRQPADPLARLAPGNGCVQQGDPRPHQAAGQERQKDPAGRTASLVAHFLSSFRPNRSRMWDAAALTPAKPPARFTSTGETAWSRTFDATSSDPRRARTPSVKCARLETPCSTPERISRTDAFVFRRSSAVISTCRSVSSTLRVSCSMFRRIASSAIDRTIASSSAARARATYSTDRASKVHLRGESRVPGVVTPRQPENTSKGVEPQSVARPGYNGCAGT